MWGVHFILYEQIYCSLLCFRYCCCCCCCSNGITLRTNSFCVVYDDVASNCHTGKKASPDFVFTVLLLLLLLLPLLAVESSTIEHQREHSNRFIPKWKLVHCEPSSCSVERNSIEFHLVSICILQFWYQIALSSFVRIFHSLQFSVVLFCRWFCAVIRKNHTQIYCIVCAVY